MQHGIPLKTENSTLCNRQAMHKRQYTIFKMQEQYENTSNKLVPLKTRILLAYTPYNTILQYIDEFSKIKLLTFLHILTPPSNDAVATHAFLTKYDGFPICISLALSNILSLCKDSKKSDSQILNYHNNKYMDYHTFNKDRSKIKI